MLIKNTNPSFGHSGPFEVESIDQLCQKMTDCFKVWASELYEKHRENCFIAGIIPGDETTYTAMYAGNLQQDFRNGLEIL